MRAEGTYLHDGHKLAWQAWRAARYQSARKRGRGCAMSTPHTSTERGSTRSDFLWRRVILAMTGSISVALMPQALIVLRQVAGEVHVLMSRTAARFVAPSTMGVYSGHSVWTDDEAAVAESSVTHIELADRTDFFLVMPATANVLAKAAHGICDDLISTAIVTWRGPIVFVPSMNETMWRNPAIEAAASLLRTRGHRVIEPVWGREIGDLSATFGVMPGIELVLAELVSLGSHSMAVERLESVGADGR